MLKNDLTKFKVSLVQEIEDFLLYYTQNFDTIDKELSSSSDFEYTAFEAFDDVGNKVPSMMG